MTIVMVKYWCRNRRQNLVGFTAACILLTTVCAPAAQSWAEPDWDIVAPSVLRIHVTGVDHAGKAVDSWGTGFVINNDGFILTAFHVIGRDTSGEKIDWGEAEGGKGPTITLEVYGNHGVPIMAPGKVMVAKADETLDVAVLKASGKDYRAVRCRTDRLPESRNAWGIGWRQGSDSYDHLGPGIANNSDVTDGDRYRFSNMTANKGNSGGPVFDENGRVLGIVTSGRNQILAPGNNETFATPLSSMGALLLYPGPCSFSQQTATSSQTDTTTGPIFLEGSIRDGQGNAVDAEISGGWDGSAKTKLPTTKQSDGRYRVELERVEHGKTFTLTVGRQGFQPQDILIRLTQGGVLLPPAFDVVLRPSAQPAPEVRDSDRSPDGRTLYFFPYALLDEALSGTVAQNITRNMPLHIRFGIVTKLSSFYRRAISVENLQENKNLAPLLEGISAANVAGLRNIGKRLNALGIITGLAGPHGEQSADPEIDVVSTYLLPADVTEDILPAEVIVEDVVRPKELYDPVFGQKLSRRWALRTILALAEKENRTKTNTTPQILAYLQKARLIAADDDERGWVDALVARLEGPGQ
jgi:Trypsin-like peptidase domain